MHNNKLKEQKEYAYDVPIRVSDSASVLYLCSSGRYEGGKVMTKFSTFNPLVEDVILTVGPGVRGSFSFLNPMGNHVTLVRRHDGDWKFVDSESYLKYMIDYLKGDN